MYGSEAASGTQLATYSFEVGPLVTPVEASSVHYSYYSSLGYCSLYNMVLVCLLPGV